MTLQVEVDAEAVAVRRQGKAALRGLDGRVFFFPSKERAGLKVVLDLLKRGQDRAAIVRNRLIILRQRTSCDGGATQTAVVIQLGDGRTDGRESDSAG